MTMSGAHRDWRVTDDLIDAVTKDLQTSTGYSASALSRRIDMALDRLDARHLDDLAHILGLVTLQLRRMAMERAKQEDAEQEAQFVNIKPVTGGPRRFTAYTPSLVCTCGSLPHALHCPSSGPFPGARWTGALD